MSRYSNDFAAGLDEKGNTLQEEYDRSKTLEKEYVQKLISFHETSRSNCCRNVSFCF
jgi:hypothetical protein